MKHKILIYLLAGVLGLGLAGCATGVRPPKRAKAVVRAMEITGYDQGKKSCNWKRNWLFRPVIARGPSKGRPKKVGVTASGTKAKPKRTIAADTRHYPFGTVIYVPGWGYGRVEDRGGAIKGPDKLDLFFGSRKKALQWGRRHKKVKIWIPR
jgi:3D (Asp-Asp-Asp) domain-containing protein